MGGINLRYEDARGLASSHSGVTKVRKCLETKRQSFFAPHFCICGQYWAFWKLFSEAFCKEGALKILVSWYLVFFELWYLNSLAKSHLPSSSTSATDPFWVFYILSSASVYLNTGCTNAALWFWRFLRIDKWDSCLWVTWTCWDEVCCWYLLSEKPWQYDRLQCHDVPALFHVWLTLERGNCIFSTQAQIPLSPTTLWSYGHICSGQDPARVRVSFARHY